MTPKYILKDAQGNSGTYLSITQGEAKAILVYLLNADGSPMILANVTALALKILKGVSAGNITKDLDTGVSLIELDAGGAIGFSFSLSAVETAAIVENSSGVPMVAAVTDGAEVLEMNFLEAFKVDVQVVT